MKTSCLLAACMLCLSGCYTVNNGRFSAHVQTLVRPGMPMDAAVGMLEGDGFTCDPARPTPSKTCSKMRQRLLPSTCVERVNLYTPANGGNVERVEVPAIACAGL